MRKLLLKTMLLLCALIVGSGTMWADTYTMSMDSGTKNGTKDVHWTSNNVTLTHSNVSWSASFSGGSIINSNNYVQIGSKNSPFTTITLSTSDISGTITEVKVGCGAYNSNATVAVTVGGNAFGGNAQTVGAAPSSSVPCDQKTFTGSASGAIVITITNGTNGRAGYIDYVSVTYTTGGSTTYSVTYNANNATSGSVPTDNTAYSSGATVTVLGNTGSLAKTGYSFGGWNTADDGTGTDRAAGSTFTISSNTTLFAKWTANTHNVTMPAADTYGTYTMDASNPVAYGTTVELTYIPASGYDNYEATWSVNNTPITGNSFSMPDENVTITVAVAEVQDSSTGT